MALILTRNISGRCRPSERTNVGIRPNKRFNTVADCCVGPHAYGLQPFDDCCLGGVVGSRCFRGASEELPPFLSGIVGLHPRNGRFVFFIALCGIRARWDLVKDSRARSSMTGLLRGVPSQSVNWGAKGCFFDVRTHPRSMTAGYIGDRHSGLVRLQHKRLPLFRCVPAAALNSGEGCFSISIVRHSRISRRMPSFYLSDCVRFK